MQPLLDSPNKVKVKASKDKTEGKLMKEYVPRSEAATGGVL